MKLGNKKIFANRQELAKMLNLRRNGLSVTSLAVLFHCDESSIRAQCNKYNVYPIDQAYPEIIPATFSWSIREILADVIKHFDTHTRQLWRYEYGEWVNKGKTYAEYLKENKK